MDNQEYIDNALYELEKVNVDELPEEIQEVAIHTHIVLMNLSMMLEETKWSVKIDVKNNQNN